MPILEVIVGYIICGFVAIIGVVVVWWIAIGRIDITNLLSEKDASGTVQASMARFQLLIFIFVIAMSFFLVVVSNIRVGSGSATLPDVPNGVLALLGISASSYAVGKAIQHGSGTSDDSAGAPRAPAPGPPQG